MLTHALTSTNTKNKTNTSGLRPSPAAGLRPLLSELRSLNRFSALMTEDLTTTAAPQSGYIPGTASSSVATFTVLIQKSARDVTRFRRERLFHAPETGTLRGAGC